MDWCRVYCGVDSAPVCCGEERAEPKGKGVRGMSNWEKTTGRPKTRWRDDISWLTWEHLRVLPEELVEAAGGREVWASLLGLLPQRPDHG